MGLGSLFGGKSKMPDPAPTPSPAPTPVSANVADASSEREVNKKQRRTAGWGQTNLASDRSLIGDTTKRETFG